ncbi:MAG TPA: hypothetical protein VGB55_10035 [Tepidisphaeraceae bacterium]
MKRTIRNVLMVMGAAGLAGCGSAPSPSPSSATATSVANPASAVVPPPPSTAAGGTGNSNPLDAPPPSLPPAAESKVLTNEELIARQTEWHVRELQRRMAEDMRPPTADNVVRVITPSGQPAAAAASPEPTIEKPAAPIPAAPLAVAPSPTASIPPTTPAAPSPSQVPANATISLAPSPDEARVAPIAPQPREPVTALAKADGADASIAKRARDYPRDLASQLDHQLSLFARDQPVPQSQDLAGLAEEDREVLTTLTDGLTNFRSALRNDNNLLMNQKIRPLIEMSDHLRSRADLSIPNAVLCREVKGYGQYTPIEPPRFPAGSTHEVIVYTEVENFSAQMNDKEMWSVSLRQELVLYTEDGQEVWREKPAISQDISRKRRRDLFIPRKIFLPSQLVIGRYILKVTIHDQQVSRVAETNVPIQIFAP